MHLNRYNLFAGESINSFEFISTGRKGSITKLIQFQEMSLHVYNLAFGDKDPEANSFNDNVTTDNGDFEKVLATVVASIYIFTAQYPDTVIHAQGSTRSRNRLYQMGINKYFDIAKKDFVILGLIDDAWINFQKGVTYDAFAIQRKNSNFEI